MITSYEVGAIFRLVDEATPVLRIMSGEVAKLDGGITAARRNLAALARAPGLARLATRIGAIATDMQQMSIGAARWGRAIDVNSNAAVAHLGRVEAAANAVTAAMARASVAHAGLPMVPGVPAAPGAPGVPGVPRGRRNWPGSPPGLHVSSVGARIPGGYIHARGSNATMLGAGLLGYGLLQEAQFEDVTARAMLTGGIKMDDSMTQMGLYKEIRDIVQQGAVVGGFKPNEVAKSVLTVERMFPGLQLAQRLQLIRTLLPHAMVAAHMKEGTTLPEAFENLVGLTHMTGTFDPAKMPELMRQFNYADMITPASMSRFKNALSYSMPVLRAGLDMDPGSIMFMTAMTQTAGITNTKSGTWIREFFTRLMPGTVENSPKAYKSHNEGLRRLGLVDDQDKPTWMLQGPGGGIDWMGSIIRLSQTLSTNLKTVPDTERLGLLRKVFGAQGSGSAALMNLPQFVEQLPVIAQRMREFRGGDDILTQLTEHSPVMAGHQAMAAFTNVLMDLASHVLPSVTSSLKGFESVLVGIKKLFPGSSPDGLGSKILVGSVAGAGIGKWFGGWPGAGLGAVIGAGIPITNELANTQLGRSVMGATPFIGPALAGFYQMMYGLPGATVPGGPGSPGGPAGPQIGKLEVNVNNPNTNDPQKLADVVVAAIVKQISSASMLNQGPGAGVLDSPYTAGAGAD